MVTMMDNHTPEQRHTNMSHIKSVSKEEIIVRSYLFSQGFRFRKNDKRYPGKPDVILPKYKTVIFVNGCYWHQHPGCKKAVVPTSNKKYWIPKLKRNVERDKANQAELKKQGWNVIVVWECMLTDANRAETLQQLNIEIRSNLM
jgi:DNA mismatch endonuclease (patch repair protein)